MFKTLDIGVEMPATDEKHGIKVHVSGYEVNDSSVDWHFSIIQWQTYASEFADDVHHNLYDVWLATDNDDLLETLEELKRIIVEKL